MLGRMRSGHAAGQLAVVSVLFLLSKNQDGQFLLFFSSIGRALGWIAAVSYCSSMLLAATKSRLLFVAHPSRQAQERCLAAHVFTSCARVHALTLAVGSLLSKV